MTNDSKLNNLNNEINNELDALEVESKKSIESLEDSSAEWVESVSDSLLDDFGILSKIATKSKRCENNVLDDVPDIYKKIEQQRLQAQKALEENKLKAEREIKARIKKNLLLAKDKNEYEDYDCFYATDGSGVKLFKARRQGATHIAKKVPCQDYCSYDCFGDVYIILTADGVSAGDRSQFGSKSICDAVSENVKGLVEESKKTNSPEESLIEVLNSLEFRKNVISDFYKRIKADMADNGIEIEDKHVGRYATTLSFAVITKNYIFTANVGDGQIIVFNDKFAEKVRSHTNKEDQGTPSITNARCEYDDFVLNTFERKYYDGVIATSDGIYDRYLCNGSRFHQYALQAKQRFLEHNEPYMPFCFTDALEPDIGIFDIGSRSKNDDCSIAMALFGEASNEAVNEIMNLAEKLDENCLILHTSDKIIKAAFNSSIAVVTRSANPTQPVPELKYAKLVPPTKTFADGNNVFNIFDNLEDLESIKLLYDSGEFFSYRFVNIERKKKNLVTSKRLFSLYMFCDELKKIGYRFSKDAIWLTYFDSNEVIHLLPNAIEPVDGDGVLCPFAWMFEGIYGISFIMNSAHPILMPMNNEHTTIFDSNLQKLTYLYREDDKFYVQNIFGVPIIVNGSVLEPHAKIEIDKIAKMNINGGEYAILKGELS